MYYLGCLNIEDHTGKDYYIQMEKNLQLRLGKKLQLSTCFSKPLLSQEGTELGDQEKDDTSVAASDELSIAWKSPLLL